MIAKGVKMDTPSTIDPRNIPTNSANSTISKFFLLNVRDLLRHHTLNASHIQVKEQQMNMKLKQKIVIRFIFNH